MDNLQSLTYFYPELIRTVLILACILYDLSIKKEDSYKVGWLLVAGLVIVSVAILFQGSQTITSLFSNAIVLDPFASFFKLGSLCPKVMPLPSSRNFFKIGYL